MQSKVFELTEHHPIVVPARLISSLSRTKECDKEETSQFEVQMVSFIENELYFFKVAFKIHSYNSLIEYDYRYILQFYSDVIQNKTQQPLDTDVLFSLELYCRGSIQKTVDWIYDEHRCSPKAMANLLVNALPENLKPLLKSF